MSFERNTGEAAPDEQIDRRGSWARISAPGGLFWSVAALALGVDQLVKAVVVASLARGESWPAEGFLRITHARNTGAAFSLLRDQNTLMAVVSLVVVVLLVFFLRSGENKSRAIRFGLAMVLGGALGNIVDRLRQGYVTDMFDVGPWPIFNSADSAIVTGMALIAWKLLLAKDPGEPVRPIAVQLNETDGG